MWVLHCCAAAVAALVLLASSLDAACTATTDVLDLSTPDKYDYNYLDEKGLCFQNSMQFWIMASNDVHITLADVKGSDDTIEIVLGGWGNSKSVIRACHQNCEKTHKSGGVLSKNSYRPFWISWFNSQIIVGTGTTVGQNQLMSANIAQTVSYVGVATAWGSTGEWAFGHGKNNI